MIPFRPIRRALRRFLWKIDLWLMPIPREKRVQLRTPEPESVLRNKILRNLDEKIGTSRSIKG